MDDKPKRKRGSPSLWSFPRAFRYEVKGDFQHVVQAIESLATKQKEQTYQYDVQISSDALDDDTMFTICCYTQQHSTSEDDKVRHITTEAYGSIRLVQPNAVVIEGYALMAERGCVLVAFLISIVIVGVILATIHHYQSTSACGFSALLFFPLGYMYLAQSSFGNFFKDLLTALRTYPMPTYEDNALGTDQASQTFSL